MAVLAELVDYIRKNNAKYRLCCIYLCDAFTYVEGLAANYGHSINDRT